VNLPLVIGPVDRRKGPSREIEQANTHNEPQEYLSAAARVKTPPQRPRPPPGLAPCPLGDLPPWPPTAPVPYRSRSTRRSSHTGPLVSRTTPSEPKTRKRSKERANQRSCVTASTVPS
jgi:hypothetical protein